MKWTPGTRENIEDRRGQHGSSQQRVAWFRRGLENGSPDACDTLAR